MASLQLNSPQVDLDRLKTEAALTLNEAFFEKLSEYCEGDKTSPFLKSVLRRTQRLAALHTQ